MKLLPIFRLKCNENNSFFDFNHKIVLENQTVLNEKEFECKMQEVEDKILTDEEIKRNFKKKHGK